MAGDEVSWRKKDNYYIENNDNPDYKISKANSVKLPYTLWCKNEALGYFKTADEAKQKYELLTKEI